MIMAGHQTLSSLVFDQLNQNLIRHIYHTLSMRKSIGKKIPDNFNRNYVRGWVFAIMIVFTNEEGTKSKVTVLP